MPRLYVIIKRYYILSLWFIFRLNIDPNTVIDSVYTIKDNNDIIVDMPSLHECKHRHNNQDSACH